MKISLGTAKRRLAFVWFAGFGLPFIILVARTLLANTNSQTEEIWNWFLPSVLPTLSLIIGVLVADLKVDHQFLKKPADSTLYILALALSSLYLIAVLSTLIMSPALSGSTTDHLQRSHIYLGPTQGLCAGCLAAFFRK